MSTESIDKEQEKMEARLKKKWGAGDVTILMVDRLVTLYDKDMKYRRIRVIFLSIALFFGVAYYISFDKIFNVSNFVGDYAALIRLQGEIGSEKNISALKINPALTRAFKDKDAVGVILLINSPGGSPVQSALIHDRIIQLRKQYPDKKLVVIAEDIMASGGYFIATGSDNIYVNRSTLIGSIGARMDSFGLDLTKKKYAEFGITRRTFMAGKFKNRLDPFSPVSDADTVWAKNHLQKTHQHFIDAVLETRKDKLTLPEEEIFNGNMWNGADGVTLGLADGISDLATVLEQKFGVEAVRDYTPASSFFAKIRETYGVSSDLEGLISTVTKIFSGGSATIEIR